MVRASNVAQQRSDDRAGLLTHPDTMGRSGFLRYISRAGITLVAATAGVMARSQTAVGAEPRTPATPGSHNACWPDHDVYLHFCCTLACPPNQCSGSGSNHTCPAGYNKKSWTCCDPGGERHRVCSECTTGSTCREFAHFHCSESWTENPPC